MLFKTRQVPGPYGCEAVEDFTFGLTAEGEAFFASAAPAALRGYLDALAVRAAAVQAESLHKASYDAYGNELPPGAAEIAARDAVAAATESLRQAALSLREAWDAARKAAAEKAAKEEAIRQEMADCLDLAAFRAARGFDYNLRTLAGLAAAVYHEHVMKRNGRRASGVRLSEEEVFGWAESLLAEKSGNFADFSEEIAAAEAEKAAAEAEKAAAEAGKAAAEAEKAAAEAEIEAARAAKKAAKAAKKAAVAAQSTAVEISGLAGLAALLKKGG